MHDLETLQSGGYRNAGLTHLKLSCPLASFPEGILQLGDTLEQLDLSGTGLSSLPANLGTGLPKLKAIFLSNCSFKVFPRELASCPALESVAFRNNGMEEIPEDAFPPPLRCLVLTGNRITTLPSSIGHCGHLQECMVASNQLRDLPDALASCKKLTLLRLSSNRLSALPSWLFTLPELAFLSFGSNPCSSPTTNGLHAPRGLASIAWSDLEVQQPLGAHTSQGLWNRSPHYAEEVAIKLFRSSAGTEEEDDDDGSAADEMAAYLAAGAHESLVTILGRIHGHPDEDTPSYQGGIVTQLIPEEYTPLNTYHTTTTTNNQEPPLPSPSSSPPPPAPQPATPSQQTTTTTTTPPSIDPPTALAMLTGLAHCLAHLHARGMAHGSLQPRHILASAADKHALLTGFRGATVYGHGSEQGSGGKGVEKVEVLAFGRVMEFVLGVARDGAGDEGEGEGDDEKRREREEVERGLGELCGRCVAADGAARPGFAEVVEVLEGLMGWRGMMRIPDVEPR
ncbi:uncharacterized protein B0H64DRAFT_420315 [Chaetomium fimeti]|uniref:Protein kinase domain-containing protein n=1 Tax=Chaetomium fimeti TaxID=1854472 RepID=A0AAE0H7T0_9PEZI|nr:hypothetical protein B0H64DRAFT_420315 [Chaetomium fimeti]